MKCLVTIAAAVGAVAALYADSSAQSLFEALRQGDETKVMSAIKNGADANSRDSYGNTLLMQTAVYSNPTLLKFLLARGAAVNETNKAGHTALMRAMPDLTKIKLLVEHGANINAATLEGHTPLMMAAHIPTGDEVVRYLIEKGADLKAVDKTDADAVMIAAVAGATGNLKLLLDAGAPVRARGHVGFVNPARAGVTQSVIDRGLRLLSGSTALMAAASADCEACVRLLLARGADAKAKTGSGITALHDAAYVGNPAMVKLLLEAGAPVNVADERGLTPLMMGANSRNKNVEIVCMLLDRGADANAKDADGRTVAEWARIGSRREVVGLLPAATNAELLKPASTTASKDMHAAVQNAVALLDKTAPAFFRNTGCISCHNVSIPMLALAEARRHGYTVTAASTQTMAKQTAGFLAPFRDNMLSGYCSVPGMATTSTYAAISMYNEGHAPDLLTDSITRCLMVDQHQDGSFAHGDTRPPLSPESSIPGTALSARAMKLYPVPALAREVESSVVRARSYLLSAKAEFNDDYAFRLLGLFWTGATRGQIDAAARELVDQQKEDGGWAQTTHRFSDAYATGVALSALAMASPEMAAGAAYRRGVDYLMRRQEAGGSWHVQTRAFGFQPYFQSGFPHDHDQWISMAATAWAAVALMPAADSARLASR